MNPNKTRKVTIKDIMDEYELELMGISVSVDGTPVNSALRISEFLFDSGIYESSGLVEIQSRYRDKMDDKEERKKYFYESSRFISNYYFEKVDEYLKNLD